MDNSESKLAPGRYCLAVCYCGECPHYQPIHLSDATMKRLIAYLARPPRYENQGREAYQWRRDQFDQRGLNT